MITILEKLVKVFDGEIPFDVNAKFGLDLDVLEDLKVQTERKILENEVRNLLQSIGWEEAGLSAGIYNVKNELYYIRDGDEIVGIGRVEPDVNLKLWAYSPSKQALAEITQNAKRAVQHYKSTYPDRIHPTPHISRKSSSGIDPLARGIQRKPQRVVRELQKYLAENGWVKLGWTGHSEYAYAIIDSKKIVGIGVISQDEISAGNNYAVAVSLFSPADKLKAFAHANSIKDGVKDLIAKYQ